jgi:5-methylcytosine-specific restriction endonuclease McrA
MNYAELMEAMSEISINTLQAKRFGKKRVATLHTTSSETHTVSRSTPKLSSVHVSERKPEPQRPASKNQRYMNPALKHQVWTRDKGQCTRCGSQRNLNYDHIRPIAFGGLSTLDNLRLLCFHCNLRAAIKIKKLSGGRSLPCVS